MSCEVDYSIYLVTDQSLMSSDTLEDSVQQAILGGCRIVQLREKELTARDFYQVAARLRHLTRKLGVPFIINDRVDIALAVNADGVHVGQSDLSADIVRHLIGPDKILGVSASNLEEALIAEKMGADYLGVGAVFPTASKNDADSTSLEELKIICEQTTIPVVAIGGINKETLSQLKVANIDGIALITAIISQADIEYATQELKALFEELKK